MNAQQMLLTVQSIEKQIEGLRDQRKDLLERLAKTITVVPMGSHLRVPEGRIEVKSSFVLPNFYGEVPEVKLVISGRLLRKDGSVGVKNGSKVVRYTLDELATFSE